MLAEKRIDIVEVGPRDGLQSEPGNLPTATKVEFIERAIAAGMRRVEVTSFVNPKRVPQMADAEAVLQALPRRDDVHYIGLVLNRKGFERAAAAGCNEIGMAVVASDTFNQRNQGVTTDASIAAWLEIAAAAKAAGIRPQVTISAAFGCPFEGEVPVARVVEIARRVAEAAPFEIALADTIGVGVPAQVTELVGRVRDALPGIPLRCHFHNTRNTGLANAFAAVLAGVTTERLRRVFPKARAVVRAMPNTPGSIGAGVTPYSPAEPLSLADAALAESLLGALGKTFPVTEDKMDAVTAAAGSGPGFLFEIVETMERTAVELGLTPEEAALLVRETFIGSAKLLEKSLKTPGELRDAVTSPNGTTYAGLCAMRAHGMADVLRATMTACRDRSRELGR